MTGGFILYFVGEAVLCKALRIGSTFMKLAGFQRVGGCLSFGSAQAGRRYVSSILTVRRFAYFCFLLRKIRLRNSRTLMAPKNTTTIPSVR